MHAVTSFSLEMFVRITWATVVVLLCDTLHLLTCCACNTLVNTGAACDLKALHLQAPAQYDFRPSATSPLVDAGAIVPPFTNGGYEGAAPDIGAYEHGAQPWYAGCKGLGGMCDEPSLNL